MKSILFTAIIGLFTVSAFAETDVYNNAVTCIASYDQNESKKQIETVTNILVFPIDEEGDLIIAGVLAGPYTLSRTSSVSDAATGLTTNTYGIPGTSITATLVFKTAAPGGDVTSVKIGTDEFQAPVLVKNQAITDEIIKSGGAGFTCSLGQITAQIPIPGLARFP